MKVLFCVSAFSAVLQLLKEINCRNLVIFCLVQKSRSKREKMLKLQMGSNNVGIAHQKLSFKR